MLFWEFNFFGFAMLSKNGFPDLLESAIPYNFGLSFLNSVDYPFILKDLIIELFFECAVPKFDKGVLLVEHKP